MWYNQLYIFPECWLVDMVHQRIWPRSPRLGSRGKKTSSKGACPRMVAPSPSPNQRVCGHWHPRAVYPAGQSLTGPCLEKSSLSGSQNLTPSVKVRYKHVNVDYGVSNYEMSIHFHIYAEWRGGGQKFFHTKVFFYFRPENMLLGSVDMCMHEKREKSLLPWKNSLFAGPTFYQFSCIPGEGRKMTQWHNIKKGLL